MEAYSHNSRRKCFAIDGVVAMLKTKTRKVLDVFTVFERLKNSLNGSTGEHSKMKLVTFSRSGTNFFLRSSRERLKLKAVKNLELI